jgi:hypothetical protein
MAKVREQYREARSPETRGDADLVQVKSLDLAYGATKTVTPKEAYASSAIPTFGNE